MKKIVLLCAGGMSTSLMVTKMKDYADSIGFECEINAYAVNTAAKNAKDADMILLGPQVRFSMDEIKVQCPGVSRRSDGYDGLWHDEGRKSHETCP